MSTSITPDTQSLIQELMAAMQSGSLSSGTGSASGAGQSSGTQNSQEEAKLAEVFQELMALLKQGNKEGSTSPGSDTTSPAISPAAGSSASATPAAGSTSPTTPASSDASSPAATTSGTSSTSAGDGPNTTTITNTSDHDEKIGQFLNGGSTTQPTAEIDLKPGQTGTLKYENGQGGYDAEADSSGNFQSTASRLEFYADAKGVNNDDVSYIDGRNASIKVSDGNGKTAGDSQSIANDAPSNAITKDAGGRATVTGWYDGSTQDMKDGGAYMESKLGTGNAYIHPDDDRNATSSNPMTMAQDTSQHYTADFGDA
ncbi:MULTISPECIES: hypothetical protein [Gluconobacter]|uniref:Uncharacterized protein n=1 Tax=Gluconobacter cadivus TaxID=2728101 RepID=A0ABR9YVP1_9PROT|nr:MULTISPECIES: hypothetical protein [Gluconobacter]MBF0888595.1 hypothetical protein [Gluconobacter cadivus]MBS1060066.1 hypothetical protein [Gluconobacter sp. Dm-44]